MKDYCCYGIQQRLLLLGIAFVLPTSTSIAKADVIYNVSLNTAPLIGNTAAPFSLYFQFTDGSGLGDGDNTVTLSNFDLGTGGSEQGTPSTFGGVTGDLSSQVVLTDTSFFNYFMVGFQPGNTLSFMIDSTTNLNADPIPDEFSFSILDSTDDPIPTTGFFDQFLELDITSSTPAPQVFPSDPTQTPVAGGNPIDTGTPVVTPVSSTPEPSSVATLGLGLLGIACARRLRQIPTV